MPKVQEKSRLTLIKQTVFGKQSKGIFRCLCGTEKELPINTVRMGKTRSCGCLQADYWKQRKENAITKHPLYTIWLCIKSRCYNINNQDYAGYGARGVVMCEEWLHSPKKFIDWCVLNGWKKGLQIDKDIKAKELGVEPLLYSPERCQFVTPKVNANNRRGNRFIEYNGRTQTLSMWANEVGIKHTILWSRLEKCKWSLEKALTTPVLIRNRPS